MHFFWPNEALTWLRFACLETFIDLNPSWKVVLWKRRNVGESPQWQSGEHKTHRPSDVRDWSSNVKDLSLECREITEDMDDKSLTNVHCKDMWNWRLMKDGMGFVADMDIVWFRPMPDFCTDSDIFITQFHGLPQSDYVPVTLMGSTKSNQAVFCDALERATVQHDPQYYESCGAGCFNKDLLRNEKWYNLGNIVYPIVTKYGHNKGVYKIIQENVSSEINANEIGLHWYGGHEQSRWFENCINSYQDIKRARGAEGEFENTITYLLTKHYEEKGKK